MYIPLAAGPADNAALRTSWRSKRYLPSLRCVCAFAGSALLTAIVVVVPGTSTSQYLRRSDSTDGRITSLVAAVLPEGLSLWTLVIGGVVVVSVALLIYGHLITGRLAKAIITSWDKEFLGVDVSMSKLETSVLRGWVKIYDMKLNNPAGFDEKWPHLLEVREAKFDLDVWKCVKAFGKVLEVDHLELKDSTAYLQCRNKDGIEWNVAVVASTFETTFKSAFVTKGGPPRPRKKAQMVLHKVDLVGLKLQLRADVAQFAVEPSPVELKDQHFEDFHEYCKHNSLPLLCVKFLGETALKSGWYTTTRVLKDASQKLEHGFDVAKQTVTSAMSTAKEEFTAKFQHTTGKIAGLGKDTKAAVQDMHKDTVNTVKTAVQDMHKDTVNTVKQTFQQTTHKLSDFGKAADQKMEAIAEQVQGVLTGSSTPSTHQVGQSSLIHIREAAKAPVSDVKHSLESMVKATAPSPLVSVVEAANKHPVTDVKNSSEPVNVTTTSPLIHVVKAAKAPVTDMKSIPESEEKVTAPSSLIHVVQAARAPPTDENSESLVSKVTHAVNEVENKLESAMHKVEAKIESVIHKTAGESTQDTTSTNVKDASTFSGQFTASKVPPLNMESKRIDPAVQSHTNEAKESKHLEADMKNHREASLKDKAEQLSSSVQTRIAVVATATSNAHAKMVAPESNRAPPHNTPPQSYDRTWSPATMNSNTPTWPTPSTEQPARPIGGLGSTAVLPPAGPHGTTSSRIHDEKKSKTDFVCSLSGIGNAFGRLNLCQPQVAPSDSEVRFDPTAGQLQHQ